MKNYEWVGKIPEKMADRNIKAAVGTPSLAVAAKRFCDADVNVVNVVNVIDVVDVPSIPIQSKSDVLTAFSMPAYSSVEHLQPICIISSTFSSVATLQQAVFVLMRIFRDALPS